MQQSAVFWWKSKRIFPTKNASIRSLQKFEWGRLVLHEEVSELQNFMGAKRKANFFFSLRLAFLVLQVTLSA